METSKLSPNPKRVSFNVPYDVDFDDSYRLKYEEVGSRAQTFERKSWPRTSPQCPRKLAEAGFYYTGKN